MYTMVSNVKTKDCIKETKVPKKKVSDGRTNSNVLYAIPITSWSPVMFAARRTLRVTGRITNTPSASIRKINGASHQIGPAMCLKKPIPFRMIPAPTKTTKTTIAIAKLFETLLVAGAPSGSIPTRLLNNI